MFTYAGENFYRKSSELLRKLLAGGWYVVSQKGSHKKLKHPIKEGIVMFPDHGSDEMSKGLERKIKKDAGL